MSVTPVAVDVAGLGDADAEVVRQVQAVEPVDLRAVDARQDHGVAGRLGVRGGGLRRAGDEVVDAVPVEVADLFAAMAEPVALTGAEHLPDHQARRSGVGPHRPSPRLAAGILLQRSDEEVGHRVAVHVAQAAQGGAHVSVVLVAEPLVQDVARETTAHGGAAVEAVAAVPVLSTGHDVGVAVAVDIARRADVGAEEDVVRATGEGVDDRVIGAREHAHHALFAEVGDRADRVVADPVVVDVAEEFVVVAEQPGARRGRERQGQAERVERRAREQGRTTGLGAAVVVAGGAGDDVRIAVAVGVTRAGDAAAKRVARAVAAQRRENRAVAARPHARRAGVVAAPVVVRGAARDLGVAVAVDVAGAGHRRAHGVAGEVAVPRVERRARSGEHPDAAAVHAVVVVAGSSGGEVGRAVVVDVAHAAHRRAERVPGVITLERLQDRAVAAGHDQHEASVGAVAVVTGRADRDVAGAIAVDVADAGHRGAHRVAGSGGRCDLQ